MGPQESTTKNGLGERRAGRMWWSLAVFACVATVCICISACGTTEGTSGNTVAAPQNARPVTAGQAVPVSRSGIKGTTRYRRATGAVTTATTSQRPADTAVDRTVASAVARCLSRAGIVATPDHPVSTPMQGRGREGLIRSGAPVTTSEYTMTLRRCGIRAGQR